MDKKAKSVLKKEPEVKEEYLKKLNEIRKQKSIRVGTIEDLKKLEKIRKGKFRRVDDINKLL